MDDNSFSGLELRAEQLDALVESLDRARSLLREEWVAGLWEDSEAAAALETLTDAGIEVIHLRDALVETVKILLDNIPQRE